MVDEDLVLKDGKNILDDLKVSRLIDRQVSVLERQTQWCRTPKHSEHYDEATARSFFDILMRSGLPHTG